MKFARMLNTIGKLYVRLQEHKNILVSVSGGSDSDIVVDLVERVREPHNNIYYVFCDTGLEMEATKRHIKYLESRYNINIMTIKGTPIPTVVRNEGAPIVSKEITSTIDMYSRGVATGIRNYNKGGKYGLTPKQKNLADYVKLNKIKVSNKCCTLAKKKPMKKAYKDLKIDLVITGERQSEGGIRSTAYTNCFVSGNPNKYMPLYYWTDDIKNMYEKCADIKHSDAYVIYGFKRTGCAGCPYNSNVANDLMILKQFEPKLYKACLNVFGESYRLHDMFNIRKQHVIIKG